MRPVCPRPTRPDSREERTVRAQSNLSVRKQEEIQGVLRQGREVNTSDVLNGTAQWGLDESEAVTWLKGLSNKSVKLFIGSPPYAEKGLRYQGQAKPKKFTLEEWVDWMFEVTVEAVRACSGDVIWVVNNPFKNGQYLPAVEGLIWRWYQSARKLERPCIWHKNAPPNRKDWFGNDWESVLCFPTGDRTWNWEAIGTPPKFKSGGKFRQRGSDGKRREGGDYPKNPVTRPRDVLRVVVGGGFNGTQTRHRERSTLSFEAGGAVRPGPVESRRRGGRPLPRERHLGSRRSSSQSKVCGRGHSVESGYSLPTPPLRS